MLYFVLGITNKAWESVGVVGRGRVAIPGRGSTDNALLGSHYSKMLDEYSKVVIGGLSGGIVKNKGLKDHAWPAVESV